MAHKGKIQLLITFVATPDKVAEVDRLVASHGAWIAEGHHRQGPKALLSYNFSKGPELKNPLDPASAPTGNTRYVLNEIYESPAGIADHWQQIPEVLAGFSGDGGHPRQLQPPDTARRRDRTVALLM